MKKHSDNDNGTGTGTGTVDDDNTIELNSFERNVAKIMDIDIDPGTKWDEFRYIVGKRIIDTGTDVRQLINKIYAFEDYPFKGQQYKKSKSKHPIYDGGNPCHIFHNIRQLILEIKISEENKLKASYNKGNIWNYLNNCLKTVLENNKNESQEAKDYIEAHTNPIVNFEAAQEKLKKLLEGDDYLGKALNEHIRQAQLWDIIPTLQTVKKYCNAFMSAKIDSLDLFILAKQLKTGKKYQTIFSNKRIKPAAALQKYILDAEIPCRNVDFISEYTFKGKSSQNGPSVRFTVDNTEPELTGKSANFCEEQTNNGEIKIMEEPSDWFTLFRQKADKGLKTLYPKEYAQRLK